MAAERDDKVKKGQRFDSPQQEAYLNLWRTYDRLRLLEDELFGRHDLTAQQYNALRLLRAARPRKVPTLHLAGGWCRGRRTSRGWSISWWSGGSSSASGWWRTGGW